MEFTNTTDVVVWIVEAGGAGILSYWLLSQIDDYPKIKALPGQWKRTLATVMAIIIGSLIAWLGSALNIYDAPQSLNEWFNLFISVGFAASATHQLTHGFRELPSRKTPAIPEGPVG